MAGSSMMVAVHPPRPLASLAHMPKCAWTGGTCERGVPREGLLCLEHLPTMEGTEVLAPLAHEAAMLEHLVKQSAAANAPTVEQHALRRSMVRALFAFIEATIWVNKQFAIRFAVAQDREAGRSTPTFDVGEVAMLREESYDLGDRGQVKLRGARVSLCDNFKFMARAQAKVHGTDYDSVVTGRGVDMLKQAIQNTMATKA